MKQIIKPGLVSWLTLLIGLTAVVKIGWVIASWLTPLPVTGVESERTDIRHALHYRYRLASDVRLKAPVHKNTKPAVTPRSTLNGYKLIGIYSDPRYAVVTLIHGAKSFVLGTGADGGEIKGYRLKDANATAARFEKGGKIITLTLYEKGSPSNASSVTRNTAVGSAPKAVKNKKPDEPVRLEGDTRIIQRSVIREYSENPNKIWKNIGLYEVKDNGKLSGFKVRFVRRGSPFEKLGLKRGDIIKSINGEPITDYATPMRMLRSADSIDDLSLTIERNHEEQELKYEVQ